MEFCKNKDLREQTPYSYALPDNILIIFHRPQKREIQWLGEGGDDELKNLKLCKFVDANQYI